METEADPHFTARQTAGGVGRLEYQVDVEDGAEPEEGGEQMQVSDDKAEDPGCGEGPGWRSL